MTKADCTRYLDLVRHDHRCATLLARGAAQDKTRVDVTDWLITYHFYILCVYVEALGLCRQKDFQDHYAIRAWLNDAADLLAIAKSYRKVEEWSRDARYEGRKFTVLEIDRFHGWFSHVRDRLADLIEAEGVAGVPRVPAVSP
jgi:hypothetical protein